MDRRPGFTIHSILVISLWPKRIQSYTHHKTMRHLLLILALVTTPLVASPIVGGSCDPGPNDGTLAQFMSVGGTGCFTQSGLRVYNFSYSQSGSAAAVGASTVAVTFSVDDGANTAFHFSDPSWFVANGDDMDIAIGWSFELPAGYQAFAQWTGTIKLDAAPATATVTVQPPNPPVTTPFTLIGTNQGAGSANLNASVGSILVEEHIISGPGGSAEIVATGTLYQASAVPEPATFALIGGGLLALAISRRRRQA